MELLPTDFEFPKNAVSLRKISVIERNVEAMQVVFYHRFSIIERKEAKLMFVPELVPEKQAIWTRSRQRFGDRNGLSTLRNTRYSFESPA
jgi:hypothetical protein